MAKNYSFIGKGIIYGREAGTTGAFTDFGNASVFEVSGTGEKKTLKNFRTGGGGNYNALERLTELIGKITLHDLSPFNLALAAFGEEFAQSATTVTDENVTCSPGKLGKTEFSIDLGVAPVVTHSSGSPTYVAGTDYVATPAGILIPESGSAITNGQTVKVDYTKMVSSLVQAFVNSGKAWELIFDGLNEADSDRPTIVRVRKWKPGPLPGLGIIGDDFAGMELEGEMLADTTVAFGKSQYWEWEQKSN